MNAEGDEKFEVVGKVTKTNIARLLLDIACMRNGGISLDQSFTRGVLVSTLSAKLQKWWFGQLPVSLTPVYGNPKSP